MMDYGFQRLVLLNSAGYQHAELPLDAAVSLVAPNNTGKTSLINALQFLLIIDRRRMDFGAYDVERSRRFSLSDGVPVSRAPCVVGVHMNLQRARRLLHLLGSGDLLCRMGKGGRFLLRRISTILRGPLLL